jgi:general secretion pathway protein F
LTVYRFQAVDSSGAAVTGELHADSPEDAMRQISDRGLTPLDLSIPGQPDAPATATFPRPSIISAAEQLSLLTEMATLLGGGVAVAEVLSSLAEAHGDAPIGAPLQRLDREVRGGLALSEALSRLDIGFPPYVYALCKAGEASGNLAGALQDASKQLDHERRVQQELRSALLYPVVLVGAGTIAVFIIFVAVVPRFANLLKGSRADIPDLSRWVIEAGMFVKANADMLSVVAAGAALLLSALLSSRGVRSSLREALLRAPLIGPWLVRVELGRWATVLGALLTNRVPIMQSMALSASAVSSKSMAQDLHEVARGLQRGISLAEMLRGCAWFPASRLNLIRVGERSGELPLMLNKLGAMETEAARLAQARVVALVEPAAILIIGGVIAVIVVAVMMAITGLNTSVA